VVPDPTRSLAEKMVSANEQEEQLYQMLLSLGQGHVFDGWPGRGEAEEAKHRFFEQVRPPAGVPPWGGVWCDAGITRFVGRWPSVMIVTRGGCGRTSARRGTCWRRLCGGTTPSRT
jgi:hypothetical protein